MIEDNKKMISIIMPAYNSENYVAEAIESVCNQSYKNWELLIVDDGSTDNTSEIIDSFVDRDSRIKAFHRENEGVSMARNFALNKATGAYVTFIDSDDVYHIDRLKKMIQIFDKHKRCDIVFARHAEFKGRLKINMNEEIDSERVILIDDNLLEKVISDSKNHFMCNIMIKSEIAKKERFSMIYFAEDFCFIRDCVCNCSQMAVLDEVLYYYRRDNENAMTSHFFNEKYVPDYMRLVENNYYFCKNRNLNGEFYKKMVAHEYAQSSMRIRKSTSYLKFVACMNDKKFREGIKFADASQCTLLERILFFLIKHKIYVPFAIWTW